ncbi:protein obstructor-E-like [Phlebotomus argentipes]|uniref:protein obstructor-E-like n=1 Tax=Phlebotomus argentipes TaxID=94469 RepID=UPI002892D057|nr:protein obstructor-E-like [Phlebotomus argentipes]
MMQYAIAICCSVFALQVLGQFNEAARFNAFNAFRQPQVTARPIQAQQRSSSCAESNGRYPVHGQCDAYLECRDGVPEEKLCPDGLLFNEKAGVFTYPCSYPIDVECPQGRQALQAAQPTDDCPHQFGYFRLGDASHCGQFMNCVDGRGFTFDCPEGLAFNKDTYRCDWPDQVPDCDAEAFLGFSCPAPPPGFGPEETRFYRSPHDCQRYFICLDGRPRLHSCGEGNAFNDLTNACDGIENVTSCYNPSTYRQAQPVAIQPTRRPTSRPALQPVNFDPRGSFRF